MNQSEYMDTLEAENAKLRREISELRAKLVGIETDAWYAKRQAEMEAE